MTARSKARPRIYLAGPDLFFADAGQRYEYLRRLCRDAGFDAVSPIDGPEFLSTQDDEGSRSLADARRIRNACLAAIDSCQGVLANAQPFHGLECDSGTAFEIGYTIARGLPVAAYVLDPRDVEARAVAARVQDGTTPEMFGFTANLMIATSCYMCIRPGEAVNILSQVIHQRSVDGKPVCKPKPKPKGKPTKPR